MPPDSQVTSECLARAILVVRGQSILLDADLAELYGVATKALNQAVRRNAKRFPSDFVFALSREETRELNKLRSAVAAHKHRDPRNPPFAFTEHGAIMLAMILKSGRAIQMSVYVVRAFAGLRAVMRSNAQLVDQLRRLEKRIGKHDEEIAAIFSVLKDLMSPPKRLSRGIGFLAEIK